MATSGFKYWAAYKKGYQLATSIYRLSTTFPKEERYALTDQIRRSSRSVCANLAECYGARRYIKHYRSKLAIAAGENYETQTWLDFACSSGYLSSEDHTRYIQASVEVGKLLTYMEFNPQLFAGNVDYN